MPGEDPTRDIWTDLRAYRDAHPPDPDWCAAEGLLPFYAPATEAQVRQTEAELGFPLPDELRRLYTEVVNGDFEFGLVHVFYGATGGCPCQYEWPIEHTIGQLVSCSGWRLHPQVEEALLRHPHHYVVVDTEPEGFIQIGDEGCGIALEIDGATGCVYNVGYWGKAPEDPSNGHRRRALLYVELAAPSLGAWFAHWLDGTWHHDMMERGALPPEFVDTHDLLDPAEVWSGLHRYLPDWYLPLNGSHGTNDARQSESR